MRRLTLGDNYLDIRRFPITIEKIEVGTLAIIPTEKNIESSKCQNRQDWCATRISPYLEVILDQNPDYFKPLREEFPQCLVFRLEDCQVEGLLMEKSIFVKYGRLPEGYHFKVVFPSSGLEIKRENILLQKDLRDLEECMKREEPLSETASEEEPIKQKKPDKFKEVPVPKGIRWSDIRIRFDGPDDVTIIVGENNKLKCNFKTMGFQDRRSGKHNKGWDILLLVVFDHGKPLKHIRNVGKTIYDLNMAFKRLFPGVDDGNPFHYYGSRSGWRPKLMFSLSKKMENRMAERYKEIKAGADKIKVIDY